MYTKKLDGNAYSVILYDWVHLHEDYEAGEIKRNPEVGTEESDEYYWMYFPSSKVKHLMVGDMRKIMEFMAKLNEDL